MEGRSVIRILKRNGWYQVAQAGSHIQLRHPDRKGRVTVPHPKKEIPPGTLRSVERQAGTRFK